jgi:hypothetical protein
VAAKTTLARFDFKIAEIPSLSFRALFLRTLEYFVYYPGGIAFFPRTCDKSDDFHLFPPHNSGNQELNFSQSTKFEPRSSVLSTFKLFRAGRSIYHLTRELSKNIDTQKSVVTLK